MPSISSGNDLPASTGCETTTWSERYGERHRQERVLDFPPGITPPAKVRLYRRRDHFVLQVWDPRRKRTLSDRVDGDLVAAIARAREIESEIQITGGCRHPGGRSTISNLIEQYRSHIEVRANAGELAWRTVGRYGTALLALSEFASGTEIRRTYPQAGRVDRTFVLKFLAWLDAGMGGSAEPRTQRPDYVLSVAHGLFAWASDPELGALLPSDLPNPFRKAAVRLRRPTLDPSAPPPVTTKMVIELVQHCDLETLRRFAPLILFGLRASEPCWLMAEDVEPDWLSVRCRPELEYVTKGLRDKRFPLVPELGPVWTALRGTIPSGPLFRRQPPRKPLRLAEIVDRYRRIRAEAGTVAERLRRRSELMVRSGALSYDVLEADFGRWREQLGWSRSATLKGLRHHFATSLANAGVPEPYIRYWMGHAPSAGALVNYTHLNEQPRQYRRLLDSDWAELAATLRRRFEEHSDEAAPPVPVPA